MSYLMLPDGIPDFSKAVISFWFRVPKESVQAGANTSLGGPNFFHMQSVLPLVTFGKPQQNKNYQGNVTNVAVVHPPRTPPLIVMETSSYTAHEPYDVDPCFVGLVCSSDGSFRIAFNIQTGNNISVSSVDWITTKIDYYDPASVDDTYEPGSGWIPTAGHATIEDASYIENAQPQQFYVETSRDDFKLDEWHHVLMSFDVAGVVSIGQPYGSSTCQLWYAIDDKDYRGPENMGPWRDVGDAIDDNAILTSTVYRNSFSVPVGGWYYQNQAVAAPSGIYSGGPSAIPSNNQPFGIPAAPKYVDAIYKVEMAEFQMFTGVTLDTGIEENRRLFITKKDKKGKQYPVNPTPITIPVTTIALGDPATWEPGADAQAFAPRFDPSTAPSTPSVAAIPPGSKPTKTADVDFTKSSLNWIQGQNLGTAPGKVETKGKITAYFPDPSIGG